ncbi:hypothetical protein ACFO1B_03130 [Dactylosporangium siamense]|uniref:Uncharacterized protein n=1 Tax=Dactylosporangium siamense TaxID=685454 RepID=A0A919PGE7_9ACTN|nr:hypothetical protein [Dactylosporangium siamense]GIG43129.1 hypothetical protein Dsi01nite_011700 [Dactylosporangium siamense]
MVPGVPRAAQRGRRGGRNLRAALRDGRVDLTGPAPLRSAFPSWIGLSPFAPG